MRVRSRKDNLTFVTSYFSETFWLPLHIGDSPWGSRFFPLVSRPRSLAKLSLGGIPPGATRAQRAGAGCSEPGLRAPALPRPCDVV